MGDIERDALIQRLYDAFEDGGLYSPDRDMVEGVYEDAVEPLRRQLEGAVGALRRVEERCARALSDDRGLTPLEVRELWTLARGIEARRG